MGCLPDAKSALASDELCAVTSAISGGAPDADAILLSKLLCARLGAWCANTLGTLQAYIPNQLLRLSSVGFVFDALTGPRDNPVQDLALFATPGARTL